MARSRTTSRNVFKSHLDRETPGAIMPQSWRQEAAAQRAKRLPEFVDPRLGRFRALRRVVDALQRRAKALVDIAFESERERDGEAAGAAFTELMAWADGDDDAVKRLEARFRSTRGRPAATWKTPVDAKTQRRLKMLGYVE